MTEHRAEIKDCPYCGKESRAPFPSEASKAGQYGRKIKAQMSYLNMEQHIPLERSCDLLEEFYGHRPSEGTIVAACAEAAQKAVKRLPTYCPQNSVMAKLRARSPAQRVARCAGEKKRRI